MDTYALQLQSSMTNEQRVAFQTEYFARRKDPVIGVLLAIFLGSFGAHRFYLGQNGIAILYILFCWTLIPHLIALIEAFFMPGRVERWNANMAAEIANRVRAGFPAAALVPAASSGTVFCTHCGKPVPSNAQFCSACGNALTTAVQA
ncbi:MAG: NINE protein [Terriglobales bacterium]